MFGRPNNFILIFNVTDICEDELFVQARDILIKVSTILTGISVLTMACSRAVSKFIQKRSMQKKKNYIASD